MAEAEYFLKIDGIPGESLDASHPDEIDVLSWSWSETQVPGPVGGEGESGKVKMEDVNFVVLESRAIPKLFLACATGNRIPQAILTCRRPGGGGGDSSFCNILSQT